MNMLVLTSRRGVSNGGMMGPAGFQAPSGEAPTPPPLAGIIQMVSTLQRLGD
jgi:hypothetical protein